MVKRIALSALSLILALVLTFSCIAVCLYCIGIQNTVDHSGKGTTVTPTPVKPALDATVTSGTFPVADYSDTQYVTYGDVSISAKDGVLSSYSAAGSEFVITTTVGGGIADSVAVNGVTVATVFYEAGDMYCDVITVASNIISPITNGGRTDGIIVNDGGMRFEFTEGGALCGVYFLDEAMLNYVYDEGGKVVSASGTFTANEVYTYEGDALCGTATAQASLSGNTVKVVIGSDTYEYTFGHSYLGVPYLTEVRANGALYAKYSYINGAVSSVTLADGSVIGYILDSDLNCIGMVKGGEVYASVYTPGGNLYALLDEVGNVVSVYDVLPYGAQISDPYAIGNTVIGKDKIADPKSGAIISGGSIIIGGCGVKIAANGTASPLLASDAICGGGTAYAQREALDVNTAIKYKVIDEVLTTLENEGYASASSLSITNGNGDEYGIADIYILPEDAAGYSIKNVLGGNKAFAVIKEGEDRAAALAQILECGKDDSDLFVDYFDLYKPTASDMVFEGQFIYLGYLIGYTASGGIISYNVYENNEDYYSYHNNIFDYDKGVYAMYSVNSFDLEGWDYTALIPGVNRETYDVVETYIEQALEVCSHTTFENVEYYDTGYYDSYVNSAYGDTLDMYVNLDPTAMVTLSESGGITVQAVPFFEQTQVRREFYAAVATAIVATVVAGLISIVVPGSGVVVIAVMKTAIITGLSNMVITTGMAMLTDVVKTELLGIELNETFNERVHRYVITALNAYSLGVVTGAFAGGLRYSKFSKNSGLNLSKTSTASERMQYRLDMLDAQYSGGLLDDSMSARMEYEQYKMLIESTDYSMKNITNNVIYCSGRDVRTAKRIVNSVKKTNTFIVNIWGGDE